MDFSQRTTNQTTINVQQVLRRLKYLHTSLACPLKHKGASLKPIRTTSSPPNYDFDDEERGDWNRNSADKRCFLALSPDNEFKDVTRRRKQISRQRVGFRPVCRGRAPLRGPRNQFTPTFRPLSTNQKSPWDKQTKNAALNQRNTDDEASSPGKERTAKSAPTTGGISSLNPKKYDCIQCFANDVERLKQTEGPEYTSNIKINRVTFSSRPRPKETDTSKKRVTKIMSEKTLDIPQTRYGGWGVRSRRRIKPETAQRNPRDSLNDFDLTTEFQTLRIAPYGSEDGTNGKKSDYVQFPPPPAPPTPVQQIDIKMPGGHLVQFRLQTVA